MPAGLFQNFSFNIFIRKILVPRKQAVRQPLRQFQRHAQAIFLKKGENTSNFSICDDVIRNSYSVVIDDIDYFLYMR